MTTTTSQAVEAAERTAFDKLHIRVEGAPSFRVWSRWNEIEKAAAWEAWQARAADLSLRAAAEPQANSWIHVSEHLPNHGDFIEVENRDGGKWREVWDNNWPIGNRVHWRIAKAQGAPDHSAGGECGGVQAPAERPDNDDICKTCGKDYGSHYNVICPVGRGTWEPTP